MEMLRKKESAPRSVMANSEWRGSVSVCSSSGEDAMMMISSMHRGRYVEEEPSLCDTPRQENVINLIITLIAG